MRVYHHVNKGRFTKVRRHSHQKKTANGVYKSFIYEKRVNKFKFFIDWLFILLSDSELYVCVYKERQFLSTKLTHHHVTGKSKKRGSWPPNNITK
ncbi:hypothetical protein JTB14_010209 [Gonioctena quinquepunctata]|nr:hypothetical protein JTB14_010209 [Gonioctena quinquepunctata]